MGDTLFERGLNVSLNDVERAVFAKVYAARYMELESGHGPPLNSNSRDNAEDAAATAMCAIEGLRITVHEWLVDDKYYTPTNACDIDWDWVNTEKRRKRQEPQQ